MVNIIGGVMSLHGNYSNTDRCATFNDKKPPPASYTVNIVKVSKNTCCNEPAKHVGKSNTGVENGDTVSQLM